MTGHSEFQHAEFKLNLILYRYLIKLDAKLNLISYRYLIKLDADVNNKISLCRV